MHNDGATTSVPCKMRYGLWRLTMIDKGKEDKSKKSWTILKLGGRRPSNNSKTEMVPVPSWVHVSACDGTGGG